MTRRTRRTALALAIAASTLTSGCALVVTPEAADADVPEGYHRMPGGMLMADVQMETEYVDLMGSGVAVPTHTRPDGTVILGPAPTPGEHAGGHDHDLPDPADFPQGIVPVGVRIPRIELVAPVVATQLSAGSIEGPPVAADLAWLEATRRPGEIGPAIVGGVATLDGLDGAFARLTELEPGDQLVIVGEDGTLLPFEVASAAWSPLAERSEVFAAGDPQAEVRLVSWFVGEPTDDAADYVVRAFALTADS